jgi:Mg-chelatase subunit ChlD
MELSFLHPWFAFAACAVAVAAGGLAFWRRRLTPMLLLLAAAALLLAGARPQLGAKRADVRHALVLDVSASMASRQAAAALADSLELPSGHSFVRYDLSDALRVAGGPRGEGTDYRRLADLDPSIDGEIVVITDGRGALEQLYAAVDPRRLILLRAPAPDAPDASVMSLTAPTAAPPSAAVTVRAGVHCDSDAKVPWKLLRGEAEVASGSLDVRANVPAQLQLAQPLPVSGLIEVTLVLDLPGDREPRNDRAAVSVMVGGGRVVQYCTQGVPEESDGLLQILRADPSNDVRVRRTLVTSSEELRGTALVVINNLSVSEAGATREQLAALAEWVRGGGSLLMAGTGGAFGPGGYRGSALEDVMPVRFRPDDSPPRRTLLLLDVSDSMRESLPGGATRLARLKEGALRVLGTLSESDQAAVIGFREQLQGAVTFLPSTEPRLKAEIENLQAGGTTHIATALERALDVSMPEGSRVLLVTDGEDMEGAGAERYQAIATRLLAAKLRLDIVLTQTRDQPWTAWLTGTSAEAHLWFSDGFADLLETLDRAIADNDRDWILTHPLTVEGVTVPLPRLVRTGPRGDASASVVLRAGDGEREWPLLAQRTLLGRTACLCTDTWGDAPLAAFWADAGFTARLAQTLAFLSENSGAVNLVLNRLDDGAELVWTGQGDPPRGDLQTSAGAARMATPGRWLMDAWPEGAELRVFSGGALIQRIALPKPVPAELQATGDDEAFFAAAEASGIRVFTGLDAWQPRRFFESTDAPRDLTWVAALAGVLLLLGGYALRRR